jgi:polysaccharide pyruvyl transferase WcaK-like protein
MEPQDLVIVGSDEVWNLTHPWYGGRPIFYGEGLQADRLVSYAASFGNYDATAGLGDYWSEKLRGFAALSVRDENSRQLVQDATGEDPELVLDPALQFPPSTQDAPPDVPDRPYVAVYGHSLPRWFREQVKSWAESAGYRLVSIGYRNDWADEQRVTDGPEEFAQLIAHAAAVVTNFFHGCVFALINDKPFACVPSAYRFNKLRDLTASVQAERHLVREDMPSGELASLLGQPLDPRIRETIEGMRRRSNRYLDRVLG